MYTVRPLTKIDALTAFLKPYQNSSMFLLGNAEQAGLKDHGEPLQGTYLGAYQQERLVGVLAHYWNGNIILQAPKGLKALLDSLLDSQPTHSPRDVHGIIGPGAQVKQALQYLRIPEARLRLNSLERLFHLPLHALKLPEALPDSDVRRFRPEEIELFTAWKVDYNKEALNAKEDEALWKACRTQARRQILEEKNYWVLTLKNQPVACSGFNTRTQSHVQIGGVWTPPELRGNGYARRVVAGSLHQAIAEGITDAVLFTGFENAPAIRAYEVLGFQEVGDYAIALLQNNMKVPQKS